mmetsp:Transcript_50747/g.147781  ORF Transcript_50747/g.147781 Transcript_50747/m.147781 type:complete len:101 (-) Transcript_50747:63-365(-)
MWASLRQLPPAGGGRPWTGLAPQSASSPSRGWRPKQVWLLVAASQPVVSGGGIGERRSRLPGRPSPPDGRGPAHVRAVPSMRRPLGAEFTFQREPGPPSV